jgi:hypothetical protein
MKPITIENLTDHQLELLETLWTLQEIEDVIEFKATLSTQDQLEVDTLIRLVILESIDNSDLIEDTTLANLVIDKFRL